jgi:predicted dehydrogenase
VAISRRAGSRGKLRVAVVGLGMGKVHVRGYQSSGLAEVVAVCDANEALLARVGDEFKVGRRYTDYDRMLEGEPLDAVSISVPNFLHAPFTIKALARGLHVLCEKPMADSVAAARRMLAAAKKARRLVMINFSYRYIPAARWLQGAVREGRLGRIYYAHSAWLRRRGIPKLGSWFSDKRRAGGGPLIDLGVHRLDLAWWLMGRPRPVAASGATYAEIGPRLARRERAVFSTEDLAVGLLRFEGGQTIMLEASWATNCEKEEQMLTDLYGTEGGASYRNVGEGYDFEALLFTEAGGRQVNVRPKLPAKSPDNETSMASFCRAVLAGELKVEGDAADGLAVQTMLEGIYRSAASGREVRL